MNKNALLFHIGSLSGIVMALGIDPDDKQLLKEVINELYKIINNRE